MRRRVLLAVGLLLAGCPGPSAPSGEEVLGQFELVAEPVSSTCSYAEAPSGNLPFTLQVRRTLDGGAVTVTLNGLERPASFDGQVLRTVFEAPRVFADCSCNAEQRDAGCACTGATLTETLEVALASLSQDQVLGGACPANALDGGMPTPASDAGIFLPTTTARGFDAVRACGELVDDIQPAEGCFCAACSMRYAVRGVRR
ncbi:MAG: hypothetical protein RL653_4168 [Pseudomonadota bacterium]|jgi:hypothetical protein